MSQRHDEAYVVAEVPVVLAVRSQTSDYEHITNYLINSSASASTLNHPRSNVDLTLLRISKKIGRGISR